MSGYDFHPEARHDLDEIWDFIRGDNLDAADRLIAEILAAIDALVPFPGQGHRRPDLTSRPLRFILVREYLIALCARRKTVVGYCRATWKAQPPPDGRYPERQRITARFTRVSFAT